MLQLEIYIKILMIYYNKGFYIVYIKCLLLIDVEEGFFFIELFRDLFDGDFII